jgi:hypothetical protein
MSHARVALAGIIVCATVIAVMTARPAAQVPAAARADSGDAAVAALVAEVRALRADMATASRNQLRAQMLLGRVQMQEQRLAYLDKQRSEAASALAMQQQMSAAMSMGMPADGTNPCANLPPQARPEEKRDCEANFAGRRAQVTAQQAREQQLRTAETDLANALQTEQARWSEFNAQLDELERSLR